MKNQWSVLISKREAPVICSVCPMVNPALVPADVESSVGCSRQLPFHHRLVYDDRNNSIQRQIVQRKLFVEPGGVRCYWSKDNSLQGHACSNHLCIRDTLRRENPHSKW